MKNSLLISLAALLLISACTTAPPATPTSSPTPETNYLHTFNGAVDLTLNQTGLYHISYHVDGSFAYELTILDPHDRPLQVLTGTNPFSSTYDPVFSDLNSDGYTDFHLPSIFNEANYLFLWNNTVCQFEPAVLDGIDLVPYFEIYDGHLKTWVRQDGGYLYRLLRWDGNTLRLELEELVLPESYDVGSSNTNLLSGGIFVQSDDVLYHSPNEGIYDYASNVLYAIDLQTRETRILSDDNAILLQLFGDTLYFVGRRYAADGELFRTYGWGEFLTTGIYQINTDGTGRQCLFSATDITAMLRINETIYYADSTGAIYTLLPGEAPQLFYQFDLPDNTSSFTLQYDSASLYFQYLQNYGTADDQYIIHAFDLLNGPFPPSTIPLPTPSTKSWRNNTTCLIDSGRFYYTTEDALLIAGQSGETVQVLPQGNIGSFLLSGICLYTHSFDEDKTNQISLWHDGPNGFILQSPISLPDIGPLTTVHLAALSSQDLYYLENGDGSDTFTAHRLTGDGTTLSYLWSLPHPIP